MPPRLKGRAAARHQGGCAFAGFARAVFWRSFSALPSSAAPRKTPCRPPQPIEADAASDDANGAPIPRPSMPPSPRSTRCASGSRCRAIALHRRPARARARVGKASAALRKGCTFAPDGDLFGVTHAGAILRMQRRRRRHVLRGGDHQWGKHRRHRRPTRHVDPVTDGCTRRADRRRALRLEPRLVEGGREARRRRRATGRRQYPLAPTHVSPAHQSGNGAASARALRLRGTHDPSDVPALRHGPLAHQALESRAVSRRATSFRSERGRGRHGRPAQRRRVQSVRAPGKDLRRRQRHGRRQTTRASTSTTTTPASRSSSSAKGKKYGYPFCFTAQRVVDGANVVARRRRSSRTRLPGHARRHGARRTREAERRSSSRTRPRSTSCSSSALPTGALPERGAAARSSRCTGSWDRQPVDWLQGRLAPVHDADGAPMPTSTAASTTFPYEVVFGGGTERRARRRRLDVDVGGGRVAAPGGVAISPIDGALYVSSDRSAGSYRIGRVR